MRLLLFLILLSSGLLAAPLWGSQKTAAVAQTLTEVAPASQARVTDWSYSADRGRLEITTQGPTRPKLFILQDPPRVVVDLPNTSWDRDPEEVTASGRVESIRISQLNDTMTRFVITATPDQPLSLSQLQLQTASPERWAVQFTSAEDLTLPTPPTDPAPLPRLVTPTAAPTSSPPPLLSLPSPRSTPSSPPPLLSFPSPAPAPLQPDPSFLPSSGNATAAPPTAFNRELDRPAPGHPHRGRFFCENLGGSFGQYQTDCRS
ncbi:MAG: AMIN domain-containing protein [Synechococcaceae cyanobacterium SM2_3_1]|nr:AMIN domain-containing protein [Synechococcaceae cyanobacterium SM2_3_1]